MLLNFLNRCFHEKIPASQDESWSRCLSSAFITNVGAVGERIKDDSAAVQAHNPAVDLSLDVVIIVDFVIAGLGFLNRNLNSVTGNTNIYFSVFRCP